MDRDFLLSGHGADAAAAAKPARTHVAVTTLGRFDITIDGQSVLSGAKMPKRPVALLLLLIAGGIQGTRRESIIERLWPDDDGADAARFKVALHRLRKLLGDPETILAHADTIRIDTGKVHVDAWALEERAVSSPRDPLAACKVALDLYGGPFVADLVSDPPLLIYQQHLEARFETIMSSAVSALESSGRATEALAFARQGLMRTHGQGRLLEPVRTLAETLGQTAQSAALDTLVNTLERGDRA